jgi:hypothetical protein
LVDLKEQGMEEYFEPQLAKVQLVWAVTATTGLSVEEEEQYLESGGSSRNSEEETQVYEN